MAKRAQPRKQRETFGAVRKLPSSRYQASYIGADGKRYAGPHTFDTLTDARGWLAAQRTELNTGKWTAMSAARTDVAKKARAETLGAYAVDWLDTRVNRQGDALRPRTRVEYERLLRTSLSPLQDERLTALTPTLIRAWYTSQSVTKTQAARAYGFLKAVLATAVEDGKIVANPCMIRGAQNASTGRKVEPPTPPELEKIVATITPRYRAAVIIAAWGGCRYGELTELRRKDVAVTPEGVVLQISRAVTQVTGEGFVIGKTKSEAGVRSIVLPPHVQQIVTDHLEANVGSSPNALLFPASDGATHLAQSSFAKHWYPARKAAGRDDMPWHALRHHGATRAALAGATLRELQERLGHSTVAAAMRYQHTAGRDQELARRMSELAQT